MGRQPTWVDVSCFQQESDRIGSPRGEAERRKLLAAAAAKLGAERVVRVLEDAVEQMCGPDLGVATAFGEPDCDDERAFSRQVDAMRVGSRVSTAPPWAAPNPPLGAL